MPPRAVDERPALARRFINSALATWGVEDLFVDVPLLASELVTNAVRHVGSSIVLAVYLATDRVRLEVRDASERPPVMSDLASTHGGGWGLHIVERLATQWGIEASTGGKTIWCEVVMPGT